MTATWEELGWERLAAGVGRCRLPGWDCTVGLVLGEGTALVVDSGSSLAEGARVREQAQRLAGRRVTHLALTHPHFDHVFGAAAFAGAEVYGAVGLDAVFAYEREEMRLDAIRNGLPAADAEEAVDALAPPRHLVSGEWTLDLGDGRQALLANVGPGHTAHDLAVLVPGSVSGGPEIVFCGDLVEESGAPQAGPDAVPSRWPDALDRLLALGGEDAQYVPGHGAVVDAAFVRRQRDELAARFGVS
ncbi:MBL fold metallo-hydrolase [Streptomyces cellostaticus]|uniref:MBL fold metallo-hydrolase n=1 Tax=Streptomyces cellostaticus TaxID=67285 RepID=A0A101NF75_9ACTN|nr:MBL fold metallo-hydrolase [Streptomyces cellostaticus]KUM92007.1 MBL fold metallo-hydrolase [Streptomyces cellostaticus]GHI07819.1 MBL fold hydrolase [Streptomyces cellostaticus]